jgi:hypothetical protein
VAWLAPRNARSCRVSHLAEQKFILGKFIGSQIFSKLIFWEFYAEIRLREEKFDPKTLDILQIVAYLIKSINSIDI